MPGKLTSIGLYKWNGQETQPTVLGIASDLSQFPWLQRPSVKEMLLFMGRTIVQRTAPGSRKAVEHEEYMAYVTLRESGVACIVVTDKVYPQTAAFSVCTSVLDEYLEKNGDAWRRVDRDSTEAQQQLTDAVAKYQDPAAADKIVKIKQDLEDTKAVLAETIDSLLQRGEKLDDLVNKSEDLSMASKAFYKQARKTNSCCRMM